MTTTLAEFLLARIDADERSARAATAGESGVWVDSLAETGDGENIFYTVTDEQRLDDDYGYFVDLTARYGKAGRERAEHIARHDPTRVLAECEAKRAAVEQYVEWFNPNTRVDGEISGVVARHILAGIVPAMAAVYSDHPDYGTWN